MSDEESFYDEVTSAFPSVEHLAPSVPPAFGDGRLVGIWALENGTAKGEGGVYGYTDSLTLALDDGPNGDQFNEMVPEAPFRVEMRHSTGYIHGKLRGRVDGKNNAGVPMRFRPLFGRVNTQASTRNKNVAAYGFAPPTDEDKAIIESHKALIISINKEMEANAKKAEDKEAFDS